MKIKKLNKVYTDTWGKCSENPDDLLGEEITVKEPDIKTVVSKVNEIIDFLNKE